MVDTVAVAEYCTVAVEVVDIQSVVDKAVAFDIEVVVVVDNHAVIVLPSPHTIDCLRDTVEYKTGVGRHEGHPDSDAAV